jgi:hypothetical protein
MHARAEKPVEALQQGRQIDMAPTVTKAPDLMAGMTGDGRGEVEDNRRRMGK